MKPKKMSLKEIQGVLSRDEMKKIMAGSGSCTGKCYYGDHLSSSSDCNSLGQFCTCSPGANYSTCKSI